MTDPLTPATEATKRCPWAIRYGVTLTTRCFLKAGHRVDSPGGYGHEGKGLKQFPYQRIEWFPEDRRAFKTDRDDAFSWEETP